MFINKRDKLLDVEFLKAKKMKTNIFVTFQFVFPF
jgi:hypothetical protein